jgi:hypothetical protein
MAATRKTIVDKSGRTIEMRSTPDRPFDPAFDSFLILHENGCDNHTLTLVLKVHLKQVVPTSFNLPLLGTLTLPFPDFNKKAFVIKPWTAADFSAFTKAFLAQCAHWTNKFWLTPPATFSALDYKLGSRAVRPNIYCHLHVDLVGSVGDAHRTIEVVNLDKAAAARQLPLHRPHVRLARREARADPVPGRQGQDPQAESLDDRARDRPRPRAAARRSAAQRPAVFPGDRRGRAVAEFGHLRRLLPGTTEGG